MAAKLFDPAVGRQRVDRYELIGEIASGGMATVYLARLTGVGGFQRFVAMKRLHPHLATEKEFVEMFLDEARLAAGIHHPNVVPILEVGASAVGYYLVMEYVEGDTLARLLARAGGRGKRIPTAITLRITLDMLAGLHAAHELRDDTGQAINLVHRDVSPQNVLVGSDGIARITDFGVARATSRLSATRVGQLKGKIAYMAPEQAQGDEAIDRRADVFAAGVMIWEALAGKRLFKADNEAATLSRVMLETVPQLSRVAPHVARPICDVVMRALERDRGKRFSTAAQFADALEAAAPESQKIGSARDLAGYVQEVLGEEIERQREAVRVWLARVESSSPDHAALSLPMPSSTVSAAAMSLPEPSRSLSQATLPDAPRGARWPKYALLAVVFFALGGGALYATESLRRGASLPPTPAPERALPAPPPAAPAVSEPSVAAAASASVAPEPAASAPGPTASAPLPAGSDAARSAPAPAPPAAHHPAPRRKKKADEAIPVNPYR